MNFLKLQIHVCVLSVKCYSYFQTKPNKSTLLWIWRALKSAFSNTAIHICKIYQALMKDAVSILWLVPALNTFDVKLDYTETNAPQHTLLGDL